MPIKILLRLCQSGYLFLLIMLIYRGFGQLASEQYSIIFICLWVTPLLLPLKGIIKGQAFTFAWAGFILSFYLVHGLTLLYISQDEQLFAIAEILLVSLLLIGFPFYARLRGRELGLGLKKKL